MRGRGVVESWCAGIVVVSLRRSLTRGEVRRGCAMCCLHARGTGVGADGHAAGIGQLFGTLKY